RRSGGRILGGPFRGMTYVGSSIGSVFMAKILGTYEVELHPVLDGFCAEQFDRFIDVGAAEGYYAVGLAFRCPNLPVIAFETEPAGQKLIASLAQANRVSDRVQVQGHCTVDDLRQAFVGSEKCLLIMDVEGHEYDLLDPGKIPELAAATLLVELHEFTRGGLGKIIRDRFATTHSVCEVHVRERTREDLPFQSRLLLRWLLSMTNECRPHRQSWLVLTPLRVSSPHGLQGNVQVTA
ncbi:MAG TPA: hypothetical protein VLJ39_06010, partial [Tepidisphaeraceae bacterium]|nr:hypothetical protein [Tepidisphaeraceae bacterium]